METEIIRHKNATRLEDMPLIEKCKILLESKLLPTWVNTLEKVIVGQYALTKIGLDPVLDFNKISIINGNVTLNAEALRALVFKNGGSIKLVKDFETVEKTIKQADGNDKIIAVRVTTVAIRRPDETDWNEVSFYESEAISMGLMDKDNWKRMPRAMMAARCYTKAIRLYCPDLMHVGFTPEELNPNIQVETFDLSEDIY